MEGRSRLSCEHGRGRRGSAQRRGLAKWIWSPPPPLSLDELKGTGAAFIFGNGYAFEFNRADQRFAVTGLPLVRSRLALPAQVIVPGQRFVFGAERRGSLLDFFIDDKLIQTVQYDEEIGAIGFEPKKATMRIYGFGAEEMYPRSDAKRAKIPTLHPPRARSLSPSALNP